VAADLKIAELVDGNVCVYMTIPKKIAGQTFKPSARSGSGM